MYPSQPNRNNIVSFALLAVIPACLISFSLFYLMQYLISGNTTHIKHSSDYSTLEFIRIKRDEQSEAFKRQLPKKPETLTPPPYPRPDSTVKSVSKPVMPLLKMSMPDISGLKFGTGPFLGEINEMESDGEVIPLVRVEPRYPRKAARNGTEGWVKLEFTILENGTVVNARVIEARPRRVFDREAKRAIQRWKFKPKIVNGKPVQQTASQVINFKLEK